ncbi:MAG: HEPN domain-containing protein [Planctomycetes bacterium]|nr:HEPN domain-containing protein [Planctomycetota bacterium]
MEKFLKGFLLSTGWRLVRTHDLESLLNDAVACVPTLEQFRAACQRIAGYYFVSRYPFVPKPALTEEDIRQSLTETRNSSARSAGQEADCCLSTGCVAAIARLLCGSSLPCPCSPSRRPG